MQSVEDHYVIIARLHQLLSMELGLQGEACGVWQHCRCLGIDPDATPEHYFCQRCRIALADPFWQADSVPLFTPANLEPVPGRPVIMRPTGKEENKLADRAFRLSPHQLEPLRRNSQTEQLHVRQSCLTLRSFCPSCQTMQFHIHLSSKVLQGPQHIAVSCTSHCPCAYLALHALYWSVEGAYV